jgi:hypothetical protein
MGLWQDIKDLLAGIFSRNPEEAQKRRELRKIFNSLALSKPPLYRHKTNVALTGFAEIAYTYCQLLRPIIDIVRKTIAHHDLRTSQRFQDLLIDVRLPRDAQEQKFSFCYEGMN